MIFWIFLFFPFLTITRSDNINVTEKNETESLEDLKNLKSTLLSGILTTQKQGLLEDTMLRATNGSLLYPTRRILFGRTVGDTRPYMVWLRPTKEAADGVEPNWLCGGVIIHERYILTSAACIEEVQHFYVVSGTHKWIPMDESNECIKYGAKKAVWKCVPKNYIYDGKEFDNIQWMIGDIAVVKTEDNFNFEKRVKGCDFVPKRVAYNNKSAEFEKAGQRASIAGWGSTETFSEVDDTNERRKKNGRQGKKGQKTGNGNSPDLLETDVVILSNNNCKKRWPERYHYIIEENMICGKDAVDTETVRAACRERGVDCKELVYDDDEDDGGQRRSMVDPNSLILHKPFHPETRRAKLKSGGFCENDHGGPLIVGQGTTAMVIGIISACLTKDTTHKCYGPFLYTSVFRNRHLISCAIFKDIGATCKMFLRSSNTKLIETTFDWSDHPDGPAKSDADGSSEILETKVEEEKEDLEIPTQEQATTIENDNQETEKPNSTGKAMILVRSASQIEDRQKFFANAKNETNKKSRFDAVTRTN